MKAKEFWESFKRQIKNEDNRAKLEDAWSARENSSGETIFTKEIKKVITAAITEGNKAIAHFSEEEHHVQTEYYRIDLIDWQQKKDQESYDIENDGSIKANYKLKKHAWDFDIAVEHENNPEDWSDEIIKLAYIFCKLRVVIGYFPYIKDEKKKHEMQLNYLNAVAKTIQELGCKDNMQYGAFMVILGDCEKGATDTEGFRKLEYTPYLYKGTEFAKQDF